MFRRCVSLCVLAVFLASQLAAVPHAHGATSPEEQQKHSATPHFHCEWFGDTDHDHDHSHGGHSHSHAGQQQEDCPKPKSDDSQDRQPQGTGLSGTDHDADAIFVFVSGQACTASTTSYKDLAASAWQLVALARLPDCLSDLQARLSPSFRGHPPDEVLDDSDIYLTLRNLRI